MGVDIHMRLINKNGEELIHNLYEGRNSEWFNNLQDRGWDDEYDTLPVRYGLPEYAPAADLENEKEHDYYGFHYMEVSDYKKWFDKYRPDLDAGWVSTYDKWRIENKHYIPEDVPHYLPDDANPADMHFVTFMNEFNCDKYVLDRIREFVNARPAYVNMRPVTEGEELVIIYYFDC